MNPKKLCNTCKHLKKDRTGKPINLYCGRTTRNIRDYGVVAEGANYKRKTE